jgi:hypothetical protein
VAASFVVLRVQVCSCGSMMKGCGAVGRLANDAGRRYGRRANEGTGARGGGRNLGEAKRIGVIVGVTVRGFSQCEKSRR